MWNIICGSSQHSQAVLKDKLNENKERIKMGLNFYKPLTELGSKTWVARTDIGDTERKEFITKLSKMMVIIIAASSSS